MAYEPPEYSDVFPPGSRPITMDAPQLIAHLRDVIRCIENDDSMEGSIMYGWSTKEPGMYDVGGIYRIGNNMGQGGVVLLWDTSDDQAKS